MAEDGRRATEQRHHAAMVDGELAPVNPRL
jgi:hypothetical protein